MLLIAWETRKIGASRTPAMPARTEEYAKVMATTPAVLMPYSG
jgi:hypothetical protein